MSDYSEIDRLGAAVAPELPAEARRMLGLQLIGGNPQDLGARGEEPGAISTVLVLDNTIDQGRIAEGLETLLGESPTVVNGLTASRASAIYRRNRATAPGSSENQRFSGSRESSILDRLDLGGEARHHT